LDKKHVRSKIKVKLSQVNKKLMLEKIKTSQVKAQISKLRNNTNLAAVLSRMGANTMTARTVPAFFVSTRKASSA